ncbi:hypothetical protein KPH14_012076 [Odynerus spinipes]|uniref:Uncharacterized protein n=1 Tax=Odynerus spinipes TaxID=1348599 RepID=A0AAD9R9Q3_9HYME|nr:hypothetical protein KPH14_012076 [Odynerus spinipes]
MFRPIFTVVLSAGLLFSVAIAIDVSKTNRTDISLTEDDVVPKTQLKKLLPDSDRRPTSIEDDASGVRYPDEIVYRRILKLDNPTGAIQSTSTELSVNHGLINYVSITNGPNSYAVACIEDSTLGTSRVIIHLRVPPNSSSELMLIVAAH